MTLSGPDSNREGGPSPSAILLVFLLYVAGTTCTWGMLCWWGLVLVVSAVGLAFWFHVRPEWQGPAPEAMLLGIFIGCTAGICWLRSGGNEYFYGDDHLGLLRRLASQHLTDPGIAIKVLAVAALLLGMSYLSRRATGLLRGRFVALLLIAVAMRVLILFTTPQPPIDVFISQTDGGKGLLEGKSVYTMTFSSPYKPGQTFSNYAYPPAVVYCDCISWLLFKDVRGMWIACDLLAAGLMYLLARRSNPGENGRRLCELLPLTFFFLPRSLFVIEQSWTEPLVVVSMAAFALAASSGRGAAWVGCLLGLWISSKQYVVLAAPQVVKLFGFRLKMWLCAAGVALALALPFVIWDFHALLEDLVLFFLRSPGRPDALSLYGLLLGFTGVPAIPPPLWAKLAGVIVGCLWIAGIAWFTWKMPRNLAGMLFAAAGAWMFFFLLGKQAFMNYFYMIDFTLLLAVAASPGAGSLPSAGSAPAGPGG